MATITETGEYYYGHGQSWLFTRTAGGAIAAGGADAISLPEIDSMSISLTKESIEHVTKRESIAFKDLKVTRLISGTGKITCSQHSADILKAYLFGTKSTVSGGAASGAAFQSGIVANDIVAFPGDRTHLSTFTSIVDSAGSPATLVNGTDYLVDNMAGVIKFLNVGGFTQPFKLNGTEDAGVGVGLFMQRQLHKWLRFKGINLADSDSTVVIDLYKVDIEPASEWMLLNDGNDVNKYEIPFELLKDTTKSSSATFGQFGRYRE